MSRPVLSVRADGVVCFGDVQLWGWGFWGGAEVNSAVLGRAHVGAYRSDMDVSKWSYFDDRKSMLVAMSRTVLSVD